MPTMPRNITVTVVVALAVFGLSTSATSAAAPVPESIRIEALDENGTPLTIDDVSRGEASHGFQPSLRTSSGNVTRWYRIAPPPMSDTPYLIALSEKVRDADLYFPRSDGTYALLRFGMNIPFDLRVYPSIFPAALLTPKMRGAKRLFLRYTGRLRHLEFGRKDPSTNLFRRSSVGRSYLRVFSCRSQYRVHSLPSTYGSECSFYKRRSWLQLSSLRLLTAAWRGNIFGRGGRWVTILRTRPHFCYIWSRWSSFHGHFWRLTGDFAGSMPRSGL